jgi:hypothetical protein
LDAGLRIAHILTVLPQTAHPHGAVYGRNFDARGRSWGQHIRLDVQIQLQSSIQARTLLANCFEAGEAHLICLHVSSQLARIVTVGWMFEDGI